LRADIDYGFAEANTTYGQIGIKVWLYKGERLVPQRGREEEYRERAPRRPQARAETGSRDPGLGVSRHVDAEGSQIPQAAARPHSRQGLAGVGRPGRRPRAQGTRALEAD